MKQLRAVRIALAVFAALSFSATGVRAAVAPEPVEINVIIPMTGFAAFIGKGYAAAFSAIEADVNQHGGIKGRPVKFIINDDAGNPQTAVELFDELQGKNANVVLAAALVAECAALVPRLTSNGPVLYCMTPAVNPAPGGYMFSVEPATDDQLRAIVNYVHKRGLTRIGVITTTDASGQDAEKKIAQAVNAPNSGVTVVANEHFNPGDLSVAAQVERIKSAKPQVVFAWATGTPFGTALRALNDAGLKVPVFTNNGNMTYAQMNQYKAILPPEMLFPAVAAVAPDGITDPAVKAAVNRYERDLQSVGVQPEFIPSVAYDPAMIVIDALRALGPDAPASKIRDYIDNLTNYPGTNGRYDFKATPQRGLSMKQVFIARWTPAKNAWSAVSKAGGDPR